MPPQNHKSAGEHKNNKHQENGRQDDDGLKNAFGWKSVVRLKASSKARIDEPRETQTDQDVECVRAKGI